MEATKTNAQSVNEVNNDNNIATTKKVHKRGISNSTRATTRKKFNEKDAQPNSGLFLGHVESVEVNTVTIGEDANGLPSFTGLAIPVLTITLASNHPTEDERRYVTKRFLPVESNVETIPNGSKAWQVDTIFAYLKHFLNVFVLRGREMTPQEEDAFSLPFEDFDDELQYVPVDPETVVAGWNKVFTNFAAVMNGTTTENGHPAFKDAKGKYVPIYMKLLRYVKNNNTWNPLVKGKSTTGDLALPGFVGEGVIELYKPNVVPTIRVDLIRESILYKETAKAPTMPMTPGNPMANAGVPVGGFPGAPAESFDNAAPTDFGATADDLPF